MRSIYNAIKKFTERKLVKRLEALVLPVLIFILISAMGLLPKKISYKLPPFLQSYSYMLPGTGYPINDRRRTEPETRTFAAGAFDSLGAFEHMDLQNGGFRSARTGRMFYTYLEGLMSVRETKDGLADTGKQVIDNKSVAFTPVLRYGNYYYFVNGDTVTVQCSKKQSYNINAGCPDPETLVALLEKETKERITLQEFCDLVAETLNGRLLRFDPKTHTAYLREQRADGREEVQRWDTATGAHEEYVEYGLYKVLCSCSDAYFILYFTETRSLVLYDKTDDSMTGIETDIEPPSAINYRWRSPDDLVIVYAVGNNVYEVVWKDQRLDTLYSGDQQFTRLICGKDGFLATNKSIRRFLPDSDRES